MKDFDHRGQHLARHAGGLPDDALPELPFGLATRVLALSRQAAGDSWDDLISAFGLRAALITACLCVVSGAFAFSEWYEFRIESPALEQSLTNQLPLTSDLPWPF